MHHYSKGYIRRDTKYTGHNTPWKREMANATGMTFHLGVHTGNFSFHFFQKENFYWTLIHKGDYFSSPEK
jgi:hypothetical protein